MPPSPRILFLDHAGVLGGAELFLLDVAQHHRSCSSVLLFEDGPFRTALKEADVPVQVVPASAAVHRASKQAGWFDALTAFPGLLSLVRLVTQRARSYDVIYANSQKAMIVGALAGLLSRRPVVWNLHDMLTADHFSSLNRRLAIAFSNHLIDRVVVNSEATRTAFVQSGGDVRKTGLVYNGFDGSLFPQKDPSSASQLKSELGLEQDTPVVGVFSRLSPWKGQHVLVRALATLPDVHAVLVGDALFRSDDGYAAQLRSLARTLKVADRLHFLGFRSDVPKLMCGVDLVLHTSTAPEPFGRVIVESQLVGTPVIATAAGGALEIIRHEDTGLLVPPEDEKALAKAIRRLLSNSSTATRLADHGRVRAKTQFSLNSMLEAMDHQLLLALGGDQHSLPQPKDTTQPAFK